jgi:hypothetical protein
MPYRDQATVESWVSDFYRSHRGMSPEVSVLEQNFTSGPESGLVVVQLRTASTVTYIQPVVTDGVPRWIVTFEARAEQLDMDAEAVAKLSADLQLLSELCAHLQSATDAVLVARS